MRAHVHTFACVCVAKWDIKNVILVEPRTASSVDVNHLKHKVVLDHKNLLSRAKKQL